MFSVKCDLDEKGNECCRETRDLYRVTEAYNLRMSINDYYFRCRLIQSNQIKLRRFLG